jgi:integrase
MSVHKIEKTGKYEVHWREGKRQRSKTFARKRAAEQFDRDVHDLIKSGGLGALDQGDETLDSYVEHTWIPLFVEQLAPKTRERYALLYDKHISPELGDIMLRDLKAEQIQRWQADRIRAGAPVESTRKAVTVLGGILQRALEAGRIQSNPQRLVRKHPAQPGIEVRPFAPVTVEAIRAALLAGAGRDKASTRRDVAALAPRDAVLVSLLGYAGLRPQEVWALPWARVGERTLIIHSPKTRRYRSEPRSVRLLTPLAQDLREWRIRSGRPGDDRPVIPALDGGFMTQNGFNKWRAQVWAAALAKVGVPYQRPYDLRHSFASLLLHEGRSAIYVGRQLGHSPALTQKTYGHVIEELEDAPRISAEEAIMAARGGEPVRSVFGDASGDR